MSETYKPNLETPLSASLDAKLDAEFDASTINLFEEEQENEDCFIDGLCEE